MRKKVQQHLTRALAIAQDPATMFCTQPFATVERDGGEQLGKLLARVMTDPNRALLVATENSFVFAFGDQVGRGHTQGTAAGRSQTTAPTAPRDTVAKGD